MEGAAAVRPRLETNPNEPLLHDVEVCGELQCQFGGRDDFVAVYVQLGGGALSVASDRAGGTLISTARVPDLAQLLVRTPRTQRPGRRHCLRVDLPEGTNDSRGVSKYIFDLGTADSLAKWQRGLSVRLSASEQPVSSASSAPSWLQNLSLNLQLGDDDELSKQISLDLSPKARAMITHHKQAQLEVVHNSIVEAKRRTVVAASSSGGGGSTISLSADDDDWVDASLSAASLSAASSARIDDVAAYR